MILVQLDISKAFDTMHIDSFLQYFKDHWSACTAKSASLLRWFLTHSRLRVQLFDKTWWCQQQWGTQQGGSHSPTLFGRVVAGRFQSLARKWREKGENSAFQSSGLFLWGLWFIDDATLLFRNSAQLSRLLPEVLSLLADMGLAVNVSKSCLFGLHLPRS